MIKGAPSAVVLVVGVEPEMQVTIQTGLAAETRWLVVETEPQGMLHV